MQIELFLLPKPPVYKPHKYRPIKFVFAPYLHPGHINRILQYITICFRCTFFHVLYWCLRCMVGACSQACTWFLKPCISTGLGMLVFFTNLNLIKFQDTYLALFCLFSVVRDSGSGCKAFTRICSLYWSFWNLYSWSFTFPTIY